MRGRGGRGIVKGGTMRAVILVGATLILTSCPGMCVATWAVGLVGALR